MGADSTCHCYLVAMKHLEYYPLQRYVSIQLALFKNGLSRCIAATEYTLQRNSNVL